MVRSSHITLRSRIESEVPLVVPCVPVLFQVVGTHQALPSTKDREGQNPCKVGPFVHDAHIGDRYRDWLTNPGIIEVNLAFLMVVNA